MPYKEYNGATLDELKAIIDLKDKEIEKLIKSKDSWKKRRARTKAWLESFNKKVLSVVIPIFLAGAAMLGIVGFALLINKLAEEEGEHTSRMQHIADIWYENQGFTYNKYITCVEGNQSYDCTIDAIHSEDITSRIKLVCIEAGCIHKHTEKVVREAN